jgi:hypothetical protein
MIPRALTNDYEKIVRDSDKLFRTLDRANQQEYSRMLKELRGEVADVYARYAAADGTLSYAEMQKHKRIDKLKNNIDSIVKNRLNYINNQTLETFNKNITTAYTAASLTLMGLGITETPASKNINQTTVSSIIQRPINGLSYDEKIGARMREIEEKIKRAVVVGFVGVGTFYTISKTLKTTIEKDFIKTRSYTGDTMHRISQDATFKAVLNSSKRSTKGNLTKTWVTMGDAIVRPAHRYLNGQTVDLEDDFEIPSGEWAGYKAQGPYGFNEPALDNYCRCWLTYGSKS